MKKGPVFTYSVPGKDDRTESGLSLEQIKARVADGRITGATVIQRSDSKSWSTASDYPEIGVSDVVVSPHDDAWKPDALTREIEDAHYSRAVRTGAGWFFWIAALSLINSFCAYTGARWGYALGLSITYQIGEIGVLFGSQGALVALGINAAAALGYFFFGIAGWKNYFLPYLFGMFIYAGDAVVAFTTGDWISAGIHALALVFMAQGLKAHMDRREMGWTHGLLLKSALCFLVVAAGGWAMVTRFNPASKDIPPETWAGQQTNKWPALVLSHEAEFRGHSPLDGASAFLLELPDKRVIAATASHLLGPDGGVSPKLRPADVDKAIVKWTLATRAKPGVTVAATGLFGVHGDWLLLGVDKQATNLPATPLKARFKPLIAGETVFVVGVRYDNTNNSQEVFTGKVLGSSAGMVEGLLNVPAELEGFSGAPVLDAGGHVVGMVMGTHSLPDAHGRYATFTASGVRAIFPLLNDTAAR